MGCNIIKRKSGSERWIFPAPVVHDSVKVDLGRRACDPGAICGAGAGRSEFYMLKYVAYKFSLMVGIIGQVIRLQRSRKTASPVHLFGLTKM